MYIQPGRSRTEPCSICGNLVFTFELILLPQAKVGEEPAPALIGVRCKQCGGFHSLRLGERKSY